MKAVNLLPTDQRNSAKVIAPAAAPTKAPTGDGFGAYVILGALALAVVAVAAMALTKNTIADRKAELARTDAQVQAVAREAAALKPYAEFKQLAQARVETVQSLATTRFDWEQALRDLSLALPRDVRLSSLKGDVRGGAGAAADASATATANPTIDLAGCTGSQTSVAKLMARLRAVRGVTRVSLRSSAKAAEDAGAGAAVASGGAQGEKLCPPGENPTFAVTIHFERFGVPAVSSPAAPVAAGGAAAGPTGSTAPAPGTTTTPPAAGTTPATPQAPAPTNSATQGVSTP
jgi:Tfp pilus assembly protein PilN